MRVFFLNPSWGKDWCRSARWAAKSRGRVQRHPDWMLIAVAGVEREGHECMFLDAAALNLEKEESLAKIQAFKPDMVVLHTTTPSIFNDLSYLEPIKQFGNPLTAVIGPHVTILPDEAFQIGQAYLDVVVRKEYDLQLRDLANGIDLSKIQGISYQQNGKIFHNPDRPSLDVNDLPFPAWHHIRPEWYPDAGKLFPFLTLFSGRGCPNYCTFCREPPIMEGRTMRMRDPKHVVDEMEFDLQLFPQIREIMFETDTFVADRKHVEGVCNEILARGLNITWSCNTRVNMDLSLLPLMKKAGCRMLMTGFEFGYQEGLNAVRKGITLKQSQEFAAAANKLGFIIHGCFMIGAPNETKERAMETIKFANSLPLDTLQISGICVYPGTEMYEWASKEGFIIPKTWSDWVDENHEQVTVLNYPNLSKQEIDELIDLGLKKFYLRPKQVWQTIKTIRSWGDIKRKLYGLKSFTKYMFIDKKSKEKTSRE
jgi:radical SAM superfamily enzyme YgiQ (UPF0313 family)